MTPHQCYSCISIGRRLGVIEFIREGILRAVKGLAMKNTEAGKELKEKYKRQRKRIKIVG